MHVFVCPANLIAWFYVLKDHIIQFSDITGQHQEYATSQQIWDKNRCFQNTYGEWTLINTWLANPPPRILQETEFLAIIQGPYHLSTSFDIIQLRESLHLPIKIRSSPPEIRVDFLNPLSNPSNPPFPPCLFFFWLFLQKKTMISLISPLVFVRRQSWDFPTATGQVSPLPLSSICFAAPRRRKEEKSCPFKKRRENWCIYGV